MTISGYDYPLFTLVTTDSLQYDCITSSLTSNGQGPYSFTFFPIIEIIQLSHFSH